MNLRRKQRPPFALALALIPLMISAWWHSKNAAYPRNDESYFFQTSQDIYLSFKASGFWQWLEQFYMFRSWKPLLVSPIGSFFLILTGGKVLAAIKASMLTYFAIFLFYSARHFFLFPPLIAATCAFFLGTIPWVFGSSLSFNSEMPVLACVVAFYFHYWRMDGFKDLRHSLGMAVWLAMAACFRPVEVTLTLGILIVYTSVKAVRAQRELRTQAAVLGLVLAFDLAFLGASIYRQQNFSLIISFFAWGGTLLVLLGGLLGTALSSPKRKTPPFLVALGTCLLLIEFWYFPFAHSTFQWAYMSSFGEWAKLSGVREGLGPLKFIAVMFWNVGGIAFVALAIGVADVFMNQKDGKARHQLLSKGAAYAISGAAPILIGAFSRTHDLRYYYISYLGFFLFAIDTIVGSKKFARVAIAAMLSVSLVQCTSFVLAATHKPEALSWAMEFFTKQEWLSKADQIHYRETLPEIHARLEAPLRSSSEDLSRYPVCILQMFKDLEIDWIHDPWALTLLHREQGGSAIFQRPWPFSQPDTDSRMKAVQETCAFVLIAPVGGTKHPPAYPMSKVAEAIMADPHYKGFSKVLEYPYGGARQGTGTALLLRNPKKLSKDEEN